MVLGGFDLASAQVLLVFLEMCLDGTELVEKLVVLQNLDILHMEVSFVVTLEFLVGHARVDALEDAQFAEVSETDLKGANRI